MKITEMYTGEYYNIARELAGGVKYLANGEKNPAYNRYWNLKMANAYRQAKSLEPRKERFIETSTTEKPIEFMATGILGKKAQYGYKKIASEIDEFMKATGTRRTTTKKEIEERAIDVSRLQTFIDKYKDIPYSVMEKKEGIVYNPAYYAQLYKTKQIDKETFYHYIDLWKTTVAYTANAGRGKSGSPS